MDGAWGEAKIVKILKSNEAVLTEARDCRVEGVGLCSFCEETVAY